MLPNAAAGFTAPNVKRIGVIDEQRTRSLEVLEDVGVHVTGHKIHAKRCALVTLNQLASARLAYRNVVVCQQLQAIARVSKNIPPRF